MRDGRLILAAIEQTRRNEEQYEAVTERGHCIVLAGPGSGKTKTLTTAIGRALLEDVTSPRGIACITYNNECAVELEQRLRALGIPPSQRVFIGTVHSFSIAHVIAPYARICDPALVNFRVATIEEQRVAKAQAYENIFGVGDFRDRWKYASAKRLREVDRTADEWRGRNEELADYIEAYEAQLRRRGLIDYDDMPLIAYRMMRENRWIEKSILAKFPVLFVDEYQDLGHPLHELVMMLCFHGGVRLFAVGDADQSIYSFTGANPELLRALSERADVRRLRLRFNYRSGTNIVATSLRALGEERNYTAVDGAIEGSIDFVPVNGNLSVQAETVANRIIPALRELGVPYHQIAVLYRNAGEGNYVANALRGVETPYTRSDNQALVPRSNRMARFIEEAAAWVARGWRAGQPRFSQISEHATRLVYGSQLPTESEQRAFVSHLIEFLLASRAERVPARRWLMEFRDRVIEYWRSISRAQMDEWDVVESMIERLDAQDGEMSLAELGGIQEEGRVALSTFHSAKGREFDAVVIFAANEGVIPGGYDTSPQALREARRLFYVGVTRPRQQLILVYNQSQPSRWIGELRQAI